MERKKRTNKNKTSTRKSRTQGRLGPYLSMRARRLQIYARRQIFQNHSLRPSPSLVLSLSNHFGGAERRTAAYRGRATIITRAGRFSRKRQRERERAREKRIVRGHVERTKRSREPKYIPKFKSSIRNDGPSAMTRRYGGG